MGRKPFATTHCWHPVHIALLGVFSIVSYYSCKYRYPHLIHTVPHDIPGELEQKKCDSHCALFTHAFFSL